MANLWQSEAWPKLAKVHYIDIITEVEHRDVHLGPVTQTNRGIETIIFKQK